MVTQLINNRAGASGVAESYLIVSMAVLGTVRFTPVWTRYVHRARQCQLQWSLNGRFNRDTEIYM